MIDDKGKEGRLRALLQAEEAWEAREPTHIASRWIEQGVRIYEELMRLDPAEIRYRISLAALRRSCGRDLKLLMMNYREARRHFQMVLAIQPDNPETHYHLGHLDLHARSWEEALAHFDYVISAPAHRVTPTQLIRSLCGSAIALTRLGQVEQARARLAQATQKDTRRAFRVEIDSVGHLLPDQESLPWSPGLSHDFVVVSREGAKLSRWADLSAMMEEPGYVQLDLTRFARFIGPDLTEVDLGDSQARLLRCLLQRAGEPVSADELREFLDRARSVGAVKTQISRLRDHLQDCFRTPIGEVLTTQGREAYKWSCPPPYRIFLMAPEWD